jgi:hypothetical protein
MLLGSMKDEIGGDRVAIEELVKLLGGETAKTVDDPYSSLGRDQFQSLTRPAHFY